MILGIGLDIVDIRRIEKVYQKYRDKFLFRIFTPIEIERARRRADISATLAKRFAAKEACAKALGTGFRDNVTWRDIGVVNLPSGQPTLELKGGAAERLKKITPSGIKTKIDLTMTDEYPQAQALVIISAWMPFFEGKL